MTPAQFRAALATCGWSARQVAQMAGRAPRTGQDWLTGRSAIPAPLADWLQRRAEAITADPAPTLAAYRPEPPQRHPAPSAA